MSTPEIGDCSAEVYERGKKFIVIPERLCLDAVYTFAWKASPGQDWQARRLLSRVTEIEKKKKGAGYNISLDFKDLSPASRRYTFDNSGLVQFKAEEAEEGYLGHRLGGIEDELDTIARGIELDVEPDETPQAVPVAS